MDTQNTGIEKFLMDLRVAQFAKITKIPQSRELSPYEQGLVEYLKSYIKERWGEIFKGEGVKARTSYNQLELYVIFSPEEYGKIEEKISGRVDPFSDARRGIVDFFEKNPLLNTLPTIKTLGGTWNPKTEFSKLFRITYEVGPMVKDKEGVIM